MKLLISAELLKLRTTAALWVGAGVSLVFAAVIAIAASIAPESLGVAPLEPSSLADLMRAPATVTGAAALLVGLLGAAAEFTHGTIVTTRLVEPRAGRVLTAKVVAAGAAGFAVGLAVELVAAVAGVIGLAANGVAIELLANSVPRVALIVPIVVALHAVLGVAVGSLFRSTAAAVGAVAAWVFVIEGVVPVVSRRPEIANWLPGGAVDQILAEHTAAGQLPPALAGVVLSAYAAILLMMTVTLDRTREL